MKKKKYWVMAALALVIFGIPAAIYLAKGRARFDFKDVELNKGVEGLEILSGRHSLSVSTTSHEGLLGSVGLVLVVDRDGSSTRSAFSRLESIPNFRPAPDLLVVEPLNTILFEGKVARDLKSGGSYAAFAANLSANQTADVVVTDEVYVGYKDRTKIPYQALRRIQMQPGKFYFFVESVTLTTTKHKVFDELTADSKVTGTAFAANGKVYVSNSGYIYNAFLGVDGFDLSLLQPQEGGTTPEVSQLLRKTELNHDEAEKLFGHLKKLSRDDARVVFQGPRLLQ